MYFAHYFKGSGDLQAFSTMQPSDPALGSLEVIHSVYLDFITHAKRWPYYQVLNGKITYIADKKQFGDIQDRLYAIPSSVPSPTVQIIQNISKKTCTIKLTQSTPNFITLAACLDTDPFLPLWSWTIQPGETDAIIEYQGTDSFTFFTNKILDTYSHDAC